MPNNYAPSYNQYLTQTAGYALPSSVRSYSVFDPSSNSWRRMTNNGMSPMQQGTQADIQAALRYADSSRGRVWDNPAPVQVPVQTPLGGSRRASQPLPREGTVVLQGQPTNDPVAEAISLRGPSTDASGVSLNPNLNYAFRSGYENFQREIPRSNMYGPLQNPRTVRSMSPDYQEASAAPVVVAQPIPAAPAQTARAVGYPTTDIFGDEMYWRTKAHRLGENDAYWNEKKRHVGQLLDAAAHAMPVLAPFGYAGAVTRGLIAPRGLATYGVNIPIEPLARATRTAQTAAARSRLTPDAQRIADFLKR